MEYDKMARLLEEEKISGIRSSWTDREIKNTIKSMLKMDRYSQLTDGRFIEAFMDKFAGYIRGNNLSKSNVKELAKIELKKQRERNERN